MRTPTGGEEFPLTTRAAEIAEIAERRGVAETDAEILLANYSASAAPSIRQIASLASRAAKRGICIRDLVAAAIRLRRILPVPGRAQERDNRFGALGALSLPEASAVLAVADALRNRVPGAAVAEPLAEPGGAFALTDRARRVAEEARRYSGGEPLPEPEREANAAAEFAATSRQVWAMQTAADGRGITGAELVAVAVALGRLSAPPSPDRRSPLYLLTRAEAGGLFAVLDAVPEPTA